MATTRVLVIATWYPSENAPWEGQFVEDQAQALSRNYDVAVIAPEIRGLRRVGNDRGLGSRLVVEQRNGIPVFRPRTIAWIPRSVPRAFSAVQISQAASSYWAAVSFAYSQVARRWGQPDILHGHVVVPGGIAAVRLGQAINVPVVITEHFSDYWEPNGPARLRRQLERALLDARCVIAVSPGLRQTIIDAFPVARIKVIGNVIDTDYFTSAGTDSLAATNRPVRIFSLGGLFPVKGFDVLLSAIRLLVRDVEIEVVIGGDGPERTTLESTAHKLALSRSVLFIGDLTREQVRSRMQWCDLFVLPSRSETFGVVLAEAMSCGKPVVATATRGAQFVIGDSGGSLVPVDNPEELARAIRSAIDTHRARSGPTLRRQIVERFGVEAFLASIGEVYNQAISNLAR